MNGILKAFVPMILFAGVSFAADQTVEYKQVGDIPTGIDFPVSIGADVADLDKDGSLEAVVGVPEGLKVLHGKPGHYEGRWLFKTNYQFFSIKAAVALGDIDNDKDIDIAYALPEGVRLFENDGAGRFNDLGWVIRSKENTSATGIDVKMTDIDYDGKPEIVYSNSGAIRIYTR
ncbi:MAG: FG-GAP-like repeat-containing protein [Candidatus Woesearchaeota archaeon]